MFKIYLLPKNELDPRKTLSLSVKGKKITINGDVMDLSCLSAGDTLPRHAINSPHIKGDIECDTEGVLNIPVRFPVRTSSSHAAKFPEPITVTGDGPITLPE